MRIAVLISPSLSHFTQFQSFQSSAIASKAVLSGSLCLLETWCIKISFLEVFTSHWLIPPHSNVLCISKRFCCPLLNSIRVDAPRIFALGLEYFPILKTNTFPVEHLRLFQTLGGQRPGEKPLAWC